MAESPSEDLNPVKHKVIVDIENYDRATDITRIKVAGVKSGSKECIRTKWIQTLEQDRNECHARTSSKVREIFFIVKNYALIDQLYNELECI